MRFRFVIPLAVALLLLAACGQKSGVALRAEGGGGDASGQLGGEQLGGDELGGEDAGAEVTGGDTGGGGEQPAAGAAQPGAPAGGPAAGGTGAAGGTPSGAGRAAGGAATGGAAGAAADRTGITDKEIRIGIHAPVTGAAPIEQRSFETGVDVYWKHVAEKGGVFGSKNVKVIFRNDEFNPVRARQVCTEMVEKEKVFLLVGGAGADQITACAQYANSVGVPYLSAGVNTKGVNTLKTYFALSQSYAQQSPLLAQLVKNRLKKPAVAMITMETPSFEDARDSARDAFKGAGIEVKADETVSKNASQSETQAKAQKLRDSGADVVYVLSSPTIFLNLAASGQSQGYNPTYIGPGITNGLNLVATAGCPAIGQAHFLSPFPQLDAIDSMDPEFRPAYQKHTGNNPDDIGISLWGLAKSIHVMFTAAGPQMSRQSLIATLESGKEFATGVFPPVQYSARNHLGGKASHLLVADCVNRRYNTAVKFATGF